MRQTPRDRRTQNKKLRHWNQTYEKIIYVRYLKFQQIMCMVNSEFTETVRLRHWDWDTVTETLTLRWRHWDTGSENKTLRLRDCDWDTETEDTETEALRQTHWGWHAETETLRHWNYDTETDMRQVFEKSHYGVPHVFGCFRQLSLNKFFDPSTPSMRNVDTGEKYIMMLFIVATVASQPP